MKKMKITGRLLKIQMVENWQIKNHLTSFENSNFQPLENSKFKWLKIDKLNWSKIYNLLLINGERVLVGGAADPAVTLIGVAGVSYAIILMIIIRFRYVILNLKRRQQRITINPWLCVCPGSPALLAHLVKEFGPDLKIGNWKFQKIFNNCIST
jgi:hypothetical protein